MTATTTHDSATSTQARCEPWTTFEDFGEGLRRVKASLEQGRKTAGTLMVKTETQVRAHPLRTLALAAAAGTAIGCFSGFVLGWRTSTTRKDQTWVLDM